MCRISKRAPRAFGGYSGFILQLLQITIGNIVAAPVRHRIELNAVRKLHLVFLEKPLELSLRLFVPPGSVCFSSPLSAGREVNELDANAGVLYWS